LSSTIKNEDVTGSRRDMESAGAAMGVSGANGLRKAQNRQLVQLQIQTCFPKTFLVGLKVFCFK